MLKRLATPLSLPGVRSGGTSTRTQTVRNVSRDVPSHRILQTPPKIVRVSKSSPWLSLLGLFGSVIRMTGAGQTEISISMRWLIPRYRGQKKQNIVSPQ